MKKIIYLLLLTLPILFVGCSDDDDVADSLVGTRWEYTANWSIGEYTFSEKVTLYFKTETSCEVSWDSEYAPEENSTSTIGYSYSKPTVRFYEYDEDGKVSDQFDATVKGDEMHFYYEEDGTTEIYYRKK